MGTGSHLNIKGVDREAQSVNYQDEAGHLPLFSKPRPAEKKDLREELKVP